MEASAKLNHQVTEVFSAVGERRGPQEGRGGGGHPLGCFVGSGDPTGGLQGPRVSTIARGPNFVALGEGQLWGGGSPGCWAGSFLPRPWSCPSTARELLRREEGKQGRPQRGEAGLARSGVPAGLARCCAQ